MSSRFFRLKSLVSLIVLGLPLFFGFAVEARAADDFFAPKLYVPIPGFSFNDYKITKTSRQLSIPYLGAYISGWYRFILAIGLIATAIMITYGGFLYIAGAEAGTVAKGKEKIKDALIGLVFLLSAHTLLTMVNPNASTLKPVTVGYIDPDYYQFAVAGDTDPNDQVDLKEFYSRGNSAAVPAPLPDPGASLAQGGTPASSGVPRDGVNRGQNQGCVQSPFYKLPAPACSGRDACYQKYCVQKSTDYPAGLVKDSDLKKFDDLYPGIKDIKTLRLCSTQLREFNDGMISTTGLFFNCMHPAGMGLIPEVHDALVKAGQIAKSKGYYLNVFDATRTMQTMVSAFCQRAGEAIANGDKGQGGLALPGASPHQIGIAVDLALARQNDKWTKGGKPKQITGGPPVCNAKSGNNQVDNAVTVDGFKGLENQKIMDDIMAEAGFRRMCGETWHFDHYKGVYNNDCYVCAFPPNPSRSEASNPACAPKFWPKK
ncbi:MAG: hypothetical protein RDU25_02270 [Patescibacteria group bacterium]|nr:hypothetical protein [Patescibacteria group bacterium]